MGAGGGGVAGPGQYFVPERGETDKVVIRKQFEWKHICIRREPFSESASPLYLIVATVKNQWLSVQIAKLVRENLDGDWFAEEKG